MNGRNGCALGVTTAGVYLLLAAQAGAAIIATRDLSHYQVIRAKSAVIRHGDRELSAPAALYDGTGLDHEHPLLASHGSDPATTWQYPITADEYPVSVQFDLGAEYLINELWVWQLQGPDEFAQGLSQFDIVMRDAEGREVGFLDGRLEVFNRVGLQPVQRFNAFGECIFLPVPDCVRFVEFRIRANRGDPDWLTIAEVAFAGWAKGGAIPEPGSSMGIVIGGVALWHWARRRYNRADEGPLRATEV